MEEGQKGVPKQNLPNDYQDLPSSLVYKNQSELSFDQQCHKKVLLKARAETLFKQFTASKGPSKTTSNFRSSFEDKMSTLPRAPSQTTTAFKQILT
jgi:hypothetical protein